MTTQEIDDEVVSLGSALYYIDHSRESALYDADGLLPQAAVKWIVSATDPLLTEAQVDDEWFDPFALDGNARSRVICSITDL